MFQELCKGVKRTPTQIVKEKNLGLLDRRQLEDICQKIVDEHNVEVLNSYVSLMIALYFQKESMCVAIEINLKCFQYIFVHIL